ncbi:uncharacterized protein LOC141903505 [Tubulanus polymorphus]|uniref:uncharacterized protein LOC141903505 n=1 Tax=Tubulanus polymorphus TaxID=672921 RepID=UPI003DA41B62
MPGPRGGGRGRKGLHKGQRRHFTSAEELQQQAELRRKELEWRAKKGDNTDDEDEEEEQAGEGGAAKKKTESDSSEESSSDESDEELHKKKGVSHLIEIENPNRVKTKDAKKATEVDVNAKAQLSRREREVLEKERKRLDYEKRHSEGKTDEARADLARLAIIRKQREDAAKKRDEEKKMKDAQKGKR